MVKPDKLQRGDRLAAVTLSWGGPAVFPERYAAGKRQLEETFGLELVEMPHALKDPDWLARNPQARADDLMQAFSDSRFKGVVSTIGGDDSIRLLPYLDLGVIRKHPKVFMGYSDTTVSHFACLKAGLVSFYGPAVMAGFAENGGMFPYLVASLEKTLFSAEPVGLIEPNEDGWTVEFLDWGEPELQSQKRKLNPSTPWRFLQGEGAVRGSLLGGCFEVLDFLRGTALWPEALWQDAILFLETSEEAPSAAYVTRVLRSLAAMGVLKKLSAILFGRPGGEVPEERFAEYDEAILQVVTVEEGLSDLAVVTRMDFGHTDPFFVLPYGVQAEVNADDKTFRVLEAAVR